MRKLNPEFYDRTDVLQIARNMLGKIAVTNFDGEFTSGRIVETEAYTGTHDRASHAFGGRRTTKNEHMYHHAGTLYIYICYGVHSMFNISTNTVNVPDAVLIRAIEPLEGRDIMGRRTGKSPEDFTVTRGPGNVGKALGFKKSHSGKDLFGSDIFLADDGFAYPESVIVSGPRIGVDSAGDDALLPYRFYITGNPYVSGKRSSA